MTPSAPGRAATDGRTGSDAADLAALATTARPRGLHIIACVEAGKGVLAAIAATGLVMMGPQPVRAAVQGLIQRFHLDPDHGALPSLLGLVDPRAVHLAAAAAFAYAVLHLVEAWGLWRAKLWASWLGCVGAALYLPFDLYAIVRHPGWTAWTVLVVNLLVVAVLARDVLRRGRRLRHSRTR